MFSNDDLLFSLSNLFMKAHLPTIVWVVFYLRVPRLFEYCTNAKSLSFRLRYIEQTGDVGKMTLLLPQPAHLLKWTMAIQTDLNVQV